MMWGKGAQEPDRQKCPGNSERKEVAWTKELRQDCGFDWEQFGSLCLRLWFPKVYLFRVMIMLTLPPFLPLIQGVKDCSIVSDSGIGSHLTLLYRVHTLIQPLIIRVRRKQIYFKLKVLETSTFSCLMLLAVFSILITSFSPWKMIFFLLHSCQLPGVSQFFTMISGHNKSSSWQGYHQKWCHSRWLCSRTYRKASATEVNYRFWNDHVVRVQQKKIYTPDVFKGCWFGRNLDDSDMKRQSLSKEIAVWIFYSTDLSNKWIWMWPQACHGKFYSMGIKVSGFEKAFIAGYENFSCILLSKHRHMET